MRPLQKRKWLTDSGKHAICRDTFVVSCHGATRVTLLKPLAEDRIDLTIFSLLTALR